MTGIEIPSEQWGALIGAAVMQSITEESRDMLIKEAIRHLLKPQKQSPYGDKRSPLQTAFDFAVNDAARDYIRKRLDEDVELKIQDVVAEALNKAFANERRGQLVENIADAIVKAFRVDGY